MKTAGIKFDKYANGSIKSVTFNYKKHGEAIEPILKNLGAIEEDEFDKEFKEGLTPDELLNDVKAKMRKWWK